MVVKPIASGSSIGVYIAHDREELEFLCDIIYEIKNGTVAGCEVIGE